MENFDGSVPLHGVLMTLASSQKLRESLISTFGPEVAEPMVRMLGAGRLEGETGGDLHDFLKDEISNECEETWSTVRVANYYDDEEFEWPIDVLRYEGVYLVRSPEHDDAGYFLSLEAAKKYVHTNWT